MVSVAWRILMKQLVGACWASTCLFMLAMPAHGQSGLNLNGAIDMRVHASPDHIVVTGAMDPVANLTIPQMQQVAGEGAYLEFAYSNAFGKNPEHTMSEFADAIRKVGPQSCILSTNFVDFPSHPQALLDYMEALHGEGISVADINLMAKTNPALALGLKP